MNYRVYLGDVMLNKIIYVFCAMLFSLTSIQAEIEPQQQKTEINTRANELSKKIGQIKSSRIINSRKPKPKKNWQKYISTSGPEKIQVEFPGFPAVIEEEELNWEDVFYTEDGIKVFCLSYPTNPMAWGIDFSLYTQDNVADYIMLDFMGSDDDEDGDSEEDLDFSQYVDDEDDDFDDFDGDDGDDQVGYDSDLFVMEINKYRDGNFVIVEVSGVDIFTGVNVHINVIVTTKNIYVLTSTDTTKAEQKRFVNSFKVLK
jgi:hypothetical protein